MKDHRTKRQIQRDREDAIALAKIYRINHLEIGSEDACCPGCGCGSGQFIKGNKYDSLKCGCCRLQAPVLAFLRQAAKEWGGSKLLDKVEAIRTRRPTW